MKFSVLMSVYVKETSFNLDLCFKSLQKQTVKADELVLVVDGPISKDLEDVIIRYKDFLNIIPIYLEKNVGLGKALSIGLTHCNNEIIARMDSDDICRENRFELQLNKIEKNPDIRVLGTGVSEFDPLGNVREKILPENYFEIKKFIKKKNPINHMTVMFYKQDILDVGGYQHHLYMEDYNLWIRLVAKNIKFHNLLDICVDVRVGEEMISRRRGAIYIKSEYQLYRLKNNLNITKGIEGIIYFVSRSFLRILPPKIITRIYNFSRRNNNAL